MTLLNKVRALALGITALNGGGVVYGLMNKKEKTIWDKWGEGIKLEPIDLDNKYKNFDAVDPLF